MSVKMSSEPNPKMGPPNEHRVPKELVQTEIDHAGFQAIDSIDMYPSFYTFVAQS